MRLSFDLGTLVLHDPPPDFQPPPHFQWDGRVDRWRAQAHHYRATIEQFKQDKVKYDNTAPAYRTLKLSSRLTQAPHVFQTEALAAWKDAGRRGVVVLPTGAGKSYVGQMVIETVQRGTLVVSPTIDLMNQWYDLLCAAFGEQIGLIGGGYYEIQDLTVTTYDSAYGHMDRLGNRWGLVIFDECHHLPGEMFSHAAEMCLAPYRLGLTATPERSDGRHALLDTLIGPRVYTKGIKELAGDYLADYVVERIKVTLTPQEEEEYRHARSTFSNFLIDHGIVLDGLAGWHRFIRDARTSTLEETRARNFCQTSYARLPVKKARPRTNDHLHQQQRYRVRNLCGVPDSGDHAPNADQRTQSHSRKF
jgi:superfamily II DNA or RNA helicase